MACASCAGEAADAAASVCRAVEAVRCLPAHARAQAGDVRGVVARVPVVERQRCGQGLAAALGMVEALLEILFRHGLEQRDPARVQRRR